MSKEISKKTNFLEDVIKSIKDLDKYEDYALELPKNAFKYLLKLILLFCVIICACYSYKTVESIKNVYVDFMNTVPEFSYKEGILNIDIEEPIVFEKYKEVLGKIVIDIDGNIEEYEQDKDIGVLILKDKLILVSPDNGKQEIYNYSEMAGNYEITEFSKQDAVEFVKNINSIYFYLAMYFAIFIYVFIIYFIAIFEDVLFISILAYFVSRISGIKLKFAPSFGIAIHGMTLPIILYLIYMSVNLFTGFEIKYFRLMYNTISYIYVIAAVLMIKTDFIQRQMELVKLAEEQEKVREEMKQQEEQESEKQKEENKEEEKNEENKTGEKNIPDANAPACKELGE